MTRLSEDELAAIYAALAINIRDYNQVAEVSLCLIDHWRKEYRDQADDSSWRTCLNIPVESRLLRMVYCINILPFERMLWRYYWSWVNIRWVKRVTRAWPLRPALIVIGWTSRYFPDELLSSFPLLPPGWETGCRDCLSISNSISDGPIPTLCRHYTSTNDSDTISTSRVNHQFNDLPRYAPLYCMPRWNPCNDENAVCQSNLLCYIMRIPNAFSSRDV